MSLVFRFLLLFFSGLLVSGIYAQETSNDRVLADHLSASDQRKRILSIADTNLVLAQKRGLEVLNSLSLNDDSLGYASFLNLMGNLYYMSSDFETAFSYYQDSHIIRETKGVKSSILASSLMNLGNVMYGTSSFDKAIEYLRSSLQLIKSLKKYNSKELAYRHNTIGLCYQGKYQYDSAEYYFLLAIDEIQADTSAEEWDVIDTYDNLADLLKLKGESEAAIDYLKKSLEISLKYEFYYDIAWTADHLADSYIKKGDRQKAEEYIQLAKDALNKVPNLANQLDLTKTIVRYYIVFYDKDSLSYYFNLANVLSDSFYIGATNKNIQEMETKYQVEKKEAALALSMEKSARLKAENESQKLYLLAAIVLLFVLAFVFLLAYQSNQRKKRISEMEMEIKDNKLDELMSEQESKAYAAMLRGQEKEKDRIARELHDRLGGTLAALKLTLKRPENKVSEEDIAILDQAVVEVRSISHNLSSGVIEKNGLNQAIDQLFRTLERGSSIKFNRYLHPAIASLGQAASLEIYRIVQELAANTIKHANASEVSLQTNFEENMFNLIYEDNGKGFNFKRVEKGMGLENIRARVKKIHGNLHIDTEKGRGTIVIVELNRKL